MVAFPVPAASIFIMPDLPSSNLLQLIGSLSNPMVIFHRKCILLRHQMDDRSFSVLFGGDSRSGHFARAQVNLLMAALSEKNPEIIAFAHGGDYIGSGKNWGQWSRWLSQHELTVAASGKVLPIIPTRGNHDGGPLFDEIFDSPGGKERENYFSTRLSPQVALVTLNSETKAGGAQRTWLGKTLQSLRPEVRWLLAEYHRPAWPAVKRPGAAQEFWVPLFEEFDVDLVVESDGHVIKRTVPIRNEKKDSTGVVYVGEGGSRRSTTQT